MKKVIKNKFVKFFLKLLVSLGFVVWVIFRTDWPEVWSYLQRISAFEVVLYMLLVVIGIVVSAYKWKILANFKNIKLTLRDAFNYYLAGTFINNFMPSFIGGDTYKTYQIGHEDKKYTQAASSVFADRITGLFGASILAIFFTLLNLEAVLKNKTLLVVNLIVLASLVLDVILALVRNHPFWKRFSPLLPQKLKEFIRELGHYNTDRGIITRAILWSFAFNLFGIALANYTLFLALGVKIGIIDFLSVSFLISIISSVPVSINNIGIKEWSYIAFFGAFGVDESAAVTAAILSRFLQMILSFMALPIYIRSKKQ